MGYIVLLSCLIFQKETPKFINKLKLWKIGCRTLLGERSCTIHLPTSEIVKYPSKTKP